MLSPHSKGLKIAQGEPIPLPPHRAGPWAEPDRQHLQLITLAQLPLITTGATFSPPEGPKVAEMGRAAPTEPSPSNKGIFFVVPWEEAVAASIKATFQRGQIWGQMAEMPLGSCSDQG